MLKRLGFKTILYTGFGVSLALVLVVGIYSFQQMRSVIRNYKYAVNVQTDPFLAASAIKVLADSGVASAQNVVQRYKKFIELEGAFDKFSNKIEAPTPPPKIAPSPQTNTEKIEQTNVMPEKTKETGAAEPDKKVKQEADSLKTIKKSITQKKDAILADFETGFSKTANDIRSYRQSLEGVITLEESAEDDPLALFDQSRQTFMASWKEVKSALLNGKDTKKAEMAMKAKGALVVEASNRLLEKLEEQSLATINKAHAAGTKAGIRVLIVLFFAVIISVAMAFLIATVAAKKVAVASTELQEVAQTVQVAAQNQVQAFQKALTGFENIKTAFEELHASTNKAAGTAKQLSDVAQRLTRV